MPSSSDFALSPLTSADFSDVAKLAREIWLAHYLSIITRAQIDYMLDGRFTSANLERYLASGDRWMYVLREGRDAVGYCSCALTTTPSEMKLEQLYVLPRLHGHGLGKRMLLEVEAKAREHDCGTLMLQVNKRNTKAIDVYRHSGFTVREEVVVDIGAGYVMDDFIMVKQIVP